jgi:leucyl/phenylalanyl-tRNA--protein transferase
MVWMQDRRGDGPWTVVPRRIDPPRPLPRSPWGFPEPSEPLDDVGDVLGVGADLEPATLVHAYRSGIFPWPHGDAPLPWFSPDPRGVLPPREAVRTRSLVRLLRRSGWETTMDADLAAVIRGCAAPRGEDGTWIDPGMAAAYETLGRLGWAHSLEVWDGERLVGGLYGVLVGGVFTGESMFHRESGASRVAFVDLCARLADAGAELVDVQVMTPHLASLGARPWPRERFRAMLDAVRDRSVLPVRDRLPVARLAPSPGPAPGPSYGGSSSPAAGR